MVTAEARQCGNCGRVVTPRDNKTPRYCHICGKRLDDVAAGSKYHVVPQRTSRAAIGSLVFGALALVLTPCLVGELPLGIVAILLGVSATKRITSSQGALGGAVLAGIGIALGTIGVLTVIVRGCVP